MFADLLHLSLCTFTGSLVQEHMGSGLLRRGSETESMHRRQVGAVVVVSAGG